MHGPGQGDPCAPLADRVGDSLHRNHSGARERLRARGGVSVAVIRLIRNEYGWDGFGRWDNRPPPSRRLNSEETIREEVGDDMPIVRRRRGSEESRRVLCIWRR